MQDERFRGLITLQEKVRLAGPNLQGIMEAVVSEYSVMPQANGIVVELRDADQLYYAAASGTSSDLIGLRLPLNASLSGMSILTGQPLQAEDSECDSRVNRQACRRVNLRSMIVVPIPHGGRTVGVLKYHSAHVAAFSDDDMMLAHLLVGPLAVGFSSVGEADAQKVSDELRQLIGMKQQFVSTVTHELRTPLTGIAGAIGLLANGAVGELPPRVTSMLRIANRNAERLKRLVDDLLTFQMLGSDGLVVDLQPAGLGSLIHTAAEDAMPYAEQYNVRVHVEDGPHELFGCVDGDRLIQAVTNLISNAVKYSPAGGVVRVSLDQADSSGVIRVEDQGPGISEAFRKFLFQPFAQDDAVRPKVAAPSTGLGLAITKILVEHMGGTVRLDETTTKGAAFEIAVPLVAAPGLMDGDLDQTKCA